MSKMSCSHTKTFSVKFISGNNGVHSHVSVILLIILLVCFLLLYPSRRGKLLFNCTCIYLMSVCPFKTKSYKYSGWLEGWLDIYIYIADRIFSFKNIGYFQYFRYIWDAVISWQTVSKPRSPFNLYYPVNITFSGVKFTSAGQDVLHKISGK